MRLYLAAGTYYEKQADVPKGTKFEAVEFPFAASPKADFVAWMNERSMSGLVAPLIDDVSPALTMDGPIAKPVGPCASTLPSPAKDDLAFRREVAERWDHQPLAWRLDLGMLAFEDARSQVKP
jgi:hypothetical protein